MLRIIFTFLSFAFTLWLICIGYQIWKEGWQTAGSIDTSILLIKFLVLTSVYFLSSALREGAKIIAKKETHARKIVLYEGLMKVWAEKIYATPMDKPLQELNEQLALQTGIALQGNVQVLRAMNQLQALAATDTPHAEIEVAYHRLLMAMRTDIGLRNFEAKKELEQIFLNRQPPAI